MALIGDTIRSTFGESIWQGRGLDCRLTDTLCLSSLAHNKHSCNSAILNLFLLPVCHPRSSRFTMQVVLFNNTYLLWKATMQKIHRASSKRIFIHLSHKDASWSLLPHFLGREYDTPPNQHRLFSKGPGLLSTLDRDMQGCLQDDFSGEQFTVCFVLVSRVLKFRGQLDEIGCNQFASSDQFCISGSVHRHLWGLRGMVSDSSWARR